MTARDSLPTPFGRYILERRIGMGGMAEVFGGHLNTDGFKKPVCIKRMLPHIVESPEMLAMFRDEAALAARLGHANIAQVFDFGEVEGQFYLAMELVDGVDLHRLMKHVRVTGRSFTIGQTLDLGALVARALSHAHGAKSSTGALLGIVHRDISPQNILLSRSGEVKVTDFGIAKAAERSSRTATGVLKGKANYMSPEQAACEDVDHRTDQFATAIMLWEMLTGRALFGEAANTKALLAVVACEVPPPSSLRPDVPQEVDDILLKALSKDREDRFADMRVFQQALLRARFSIGADPMQEQLSTLLGELVGPKSGPVHVVDVGPGERSSPNAETSLLVKRAPAPAARDGLADGDDADLSVFDSASAIQRTASGPKYAALIERLGREHPFRGDYADLVERFPCLAAAPGVRPWNPFELDAWAKGVSVDELEHWRPGVGRARDRASFLAATFVISSYFGRSPTMMSAAQDVWDTEHKAAYASFFQHWGQSSPFSHPWWQR